MRRRHIAVLASLLALAVLFRGPVLMASAAGNLGMTAFRDALLEAGQSSGPQQASSYPLLGALQQGDVGSAAEYFEFAATLDPDSLAARWRLARAALAAGDKEGAAQHLRRVVSRARYDPLLCNDAFVAYGNEHTLELLETTPCAWLSPASMARSAREAVALAYLEIGAFEDAKTFHPGDLYASYNLWRRTQQLGDHDKSEVYRDELVHFSLEAISPAAEGLLDYVADVIPYLLDEGLWDRKETLNVVSFLVWQRNDAEPLLRLVERLADRYPAEPDWIFFLGELYHRRGDLVRAELVYQQVLRVDPRYAQAHLRLGIVRQSRSSKSDNHEGLKAAVEAFDQYNRMAPGDVLGLKHLCEACAALADAGIHDESCQQAAERARPGSDLTVNSSPGSVLCEALVTRTEDRRIVAELLVIPEGDVGLGPNLIENGDFEGARADSFVDWSWSDMATGGPWNRGEFFGGSDEFGLWSQSARLTGFWVEVRPEKEPGRAGFWHSGVQLQPGQPYVLSFDYCTDGLPSRQAALWLSYDRRVFFANDYRLRDTSGLWKHFVVVGRNGTADTVRLRPFVRVLSAGSLVFDSFSVREVIIDPKFPLGDLHPVFNVE